MIITGSPKKRVALFASLVLVSLPAGIGAADARPGETESRAGSSFAAVTPVLTTPAARNLADRRINEAQLRALLTFIAADELEGRDTPSRGLDTAAKFIAYNLSRWGLKPLGGDGSFFQKVPLTRKRVNSKKSAATVGGKALRYGEDFVISDTRSLAGGAAAGPLVYVGHGWVIKSKGIDAYKGIDVKGKILVLSGSFLPRGVNFNELSDEAQGEDWLSPALYAKRNGALGILRLPTRTDPLIWEQTRRTAERAAEGEPRLARAASGVSASAVQAEMPGIPAITLSPGSASALLNGEKVNLDEVLRRTDTGEALDPFLLSADKTANFTVSVETENSYTQNVVAVIEGSDPKLKSEYVAFGAHYDHVGVGRPNDKGDAVYNGADDDGSGTVALMAMAEALAASPQRPKRSVLFVWHCGEEKGLWGSQYFTDNPTVPLKQIAAQLNIDMIGRSKRQGDAVARNSSLSGPSEIYTIGPRVMSRELQSTLDQVNRAYLNLTFNPRYDDVSEPNRFFFRSDHYHYAKNGIPIAFFFDGVHEDYHRPSDEVERIDFAKLERVTRTIFATGIELANRPTRPKVDRVP